MTVETAGSQIYTIEIYTEIRTAWFEKMVRHTDEVSAMLGKVLRDDLMCFDGNLFTLSRSRSVVSAWDCRGGSNSTIMD